MARFPVRRPTPRLLVSGCLLALCVSAPAQDPTPLLPSDIQEYDFFGEQVAAAPDMLVVAAPFADVDDVFNAGKLYVYEQDDALGWQQTATLTAPWIGLNDRLGQALDTDGQRIVAGSRTVQSGVHEAGGVDVFVRAGDRWVHEQRILPNEPQFNGRFGLEVAIDGDRLAVGAPHHDAPFENEGEVWMYELGPGGWRLTEVLASPEPNVEGLFGQSVDLQGGRLAVGAPSETVGPGFAHGSAYIFELRDQRWRLAADLALVDPVSFDQFGMSVALHGDRVAVGAPFTDEHGNASGDVHVYEFAFGAWRRLDRVLSPSPEPDDHFGRIVSLEGDLLAVSELDPPTHTIAGVGAVQLYRWDGHEFVHERSFQAPLAPLPGGFADTISLCQGNLVSGSPDDSTAGTLTGVAWVFGTN